MAFGKDEQKAITMEEVMALIKQMSDSNSENNKVLAKELAYGITHPEPTEDELRRRQANIDSRIESAQMEELAKKLKRERCPHKRVGTQWGMFNGSSLIAWHYTNFSYRKDDGTSGDGPTVAIGVCQHCQSEFRPGDPDYAEKLSWGTSPVEGVFPMHKSLGIWTN